MLRFASTHIALAFVVLLFVVVYPEADMPTDASQNNRHAPVAQLRQELQAVSKLSELLMLHKFNDSATLDLFRQNAVGIPDLLHPPSNMILSKEQNLTVQVAKFFHLDLSAIQRKIAKLMKGHERMKGQHITHQTERKYNHNDPETVSCGRHRALNCEQCLIGQFTASCRGDCTWSTSLAKCISADVRHFDSVTNASSKKVDPRTFWPATSKSSAALKMRISKWLHQRETARCVRTEVLNVGCTNYTIENLGFDPFLGWVDTIDECQKLCQVHPSGSCRYFFTFASGACFWRGQDYKQECATGHGDGFLGPANCSTPLSDPGAIGRYQMVFVGGPHFSGTSIMNKILGQSSNSTLLTNTGAVEDEGQHLQFAYPSAARVGSLSFGCHDDAWLTEKSPWITSEAQKSMLDAWGRHWDLSKPVLVEKSPPNVAHMRFLQKMFHDAQRVAFVMTVRHPLGILHGRIPSFGEFMLSKNSRFEQTPCSHLLSYAVSKLRCMLDTYRRIFADERFVENLRLYQIEHFMDNIEAGIQDLSEFVGLHDLGDHITYFEEVQSGTKNRSPRVKAALTVRERSVKRPSKAHKSLSEQREGFCSLTCQASFSCDQILDMARTDPTLALGDDRLSCGLLEKDFGCDCRSCTCKATRAETAGEAKARHRAYEKRKRESSLEKAVHKINKARAKKHRRNESASVSAHRRLQQDLGDASATALEGISIHKPRRDLFLWGGHQKFHLDPSLTWGWVDDWESILQHMHTPTNIKETDILAHVNETELSWWLWSKVLTENRDLIRKIQNITG